MLSVIIFRKTQTGHTNPTENATEKANKRYNHDVDEDHPAPGEVVGGLVAKGQG